MEIMISSSSLQVTRALLDICQMVYRGQGRSRLRSTGSSNRMQFHCLHCNGESFESAGKWRDHMFECHRDLFANENIMAIVEDKPRKQSIKPPNTQS